MKFKFFKQLVCTHDWKKDASFYQLQKDDHKVLWVCDKCKKHLLMDRWNQPEGVIG
jgi:hypothetical protein